MQKGKWLDQSRCAAGNRGAERIGATGPGRIDQIPHGTGSGNNQQQQQRECSKGIRRVVASGGSRHNSQQKNCKEQNRKNNPRSSGRRHQVENALTK
jgi:hypothetical protein